MITDIATVNLKIMVFTHTVDNYLLFMTDMKIGEVPEKVKMHQ